MLRVCRSLMHVGVHDLGSIIREIDGWYRSRVDASFAIVANTVW